MDRPKLGEETPDEEQIEEQVQDIMFEGSSTVREATREGGELSDEEQETWDALEDLADDNYETPDEIGKLIEQLKGIVFAEDNEIAAAVRRELDKAIEDIADAIADEEGLNRSQD